MEAMPMPPPPKPAAPGASQIPRFADLKAQYKRDDLGGEAYMCNLSCLTSEDYRHVYEPNEDSYLLIDALNLECKHFLLEHFKKREMQEGDKVTVLEIGVGSGAVINSFYQLLKRAEILTDEEKFCLIGSDINDRALEAAAKVAQLNDNQNLALLPDTNLLF